MLASDHFSESPAFAFIPAMHTTILLLIKIVMRIKSHSGIEARSLTGSTSRFEPKNFSDSKKS